MESERHCASSRIPQSQLWDRWAVKAPRPRYPPYRTGRVLSEGRSMAAPPGRLRRQPVRLMARASSTSTKITHRALDLPMPQKKLYRSQVAFTAVNAVSTSSMLSYHALNVPWGRLQCMLIALLPASPWRGRRRKSVMLVREPQAGAHGGEYRARKVPGCAAHTL
jgi:hypothetical protein